MASKNELSAGAARILSGSKSRTEVSADARPQDIHSTHESEFRYSFLEFLRDSVRDLYEDFFPSGKRQKAERKQREEEERQARDRLRKFDHYLHNLDMLLHGERFDAAEDLLSFLQREYPEQEDELQIQALDLHEKKINTEIRTLDTELKESMIRICDERDEAALEALKSQVVQMLGRLEPQIIELEKEHDELVAYDIHRKQSSRKYELERRIRITKELQKFWGSVLEKAHRLEEYLSQPPNEVLRLSLHSDIRFR